MITNINYKGELKPDDMISIEFDNMNPPVQKIVKTGLGKMIIFRSGKMRLMGLKKPPDNLDSLPYIPAKFELQSFTLTDDLHSKINLIHLANALPRKSFWYEPELFPALRLLDYNPLCVNVFGSGKIVVLGARDISKVNLLVESIRSTINNALKMK